MIVVGSSNELVVSRIEKVADASDFAGNLVNVFLRRNACVLCIILNFLTVFVSTCQEENIIALHSLEPRNCVG